jgi:hypothetical protein
MRLLRTAQADFTVTGLQELQDGLQYVTDTLQILYLQFFRDVVSLQLLFYLCNAD